MRNELEVGGSRAGKEKTFIALSWKWISLFITPRTDDMTFNVESLYHDLSYPSCPSIWNNGMIRITASMSYLVCTFTVWFVSLLLFDNFPMHLRAAEITRNVKGLSELKGLVRKQQTWQWIRLVVVVLMAEEGCNIATARGHSEKKRVTSNEKGEKKSWGRQALWHESDSYKKGRVEWKLSLWQRPGQGSHSYQTQLHHTHTAEVHSLPANFKRS